MDCQVTPGVSNTPTSRQEFVSFDGAVRARGLLQRPDRYRYWQAQSFPQTTIPRGAGLSYVAASFRQDGLSVEHTSFNRVIDFDSATSIVEVEAGISLAALYDFLAPRGLYLPTQPGHGRITVGGCIAADVHGKNQARDGTFVEQIEALTLFHPAHGTLAVSREREPELFHLTCGGYGLTGHVIRARLRAKPVPSNLVELDFIQVEDAIDGCAQLERGAQHADFLISWHDFSSRGASMGPGFVQIARFVTNDSSRMATTAVIGEPPALSAGNRGRWRICLLNPLTTRVLNAGYKWKQRFPSPKRVPLRNVLFPIHQTQCYFKLFGVRGFHEFQVVVPMPKFSEFVSSIQDYLVRHRSLITLASAKLFRGPAKLLRFSGDGICLALNCPRDAQAPAFLSFLDELTIAVSGKPNIIKDSRLPRAVVEETYPGIVPFRKILRDFDPKRRIQSEMSERLGL